MWIFLRMRKGENVITFSPLPPLCVSGKCANSSAAFYNASIIALKVALGRIAWAVLIGSGA